MQFNESIKHEQRNLSAEIKRRTRDEVFAIVRKVLTDLASADLESQMTGVFIDRFKKLDTAEKEQMLSEVRKTRGELTVRTVYKLAPTQQKILTDILNNSHFGELKIRFETASDLISGIELVAEGYKLVWSIDDYLLAMEENLEKALSDKS